MPLTFRARLTLWYTLALAILLALTAAVMLYALKRAAQKKFDTALWMLGAKEAESAAANLLQRHIERPDSQTISKAQYQESLEFQSSPLEKYVTVVDDTFRVADMTSNLPAPLPTDKTLLARSLTGEVNYQTVKVNGIGSLRVVYMPVRGRAIPHPFVVIVGLPESFIGGGSKFRLLALLAVLLLVVLIAITGAWLAERAIKPIEEIIAAAEFIGADNLQARLPVPPARDQIRRLATVLNQMLERLESAFNAQRNFTMRAAHELRTPLTILKGETQVTLLRRRTVEEYEAQLKSNLEEIEKLVVLIDDLLLLARYEGGEKDIPREDVRFDRVVAECAEELRHIAEGKKIELQVEAQETVIKGDERALRRLVCQLGQNALDYTPSGGRVAVRAHPRDGRVELTVEDTGIGIASEDLPHIFQRFYRASAARELRPEGSGIGLTMVSAIARLHGATIEVASERGAGSRFTVKFPASA